jgi:ubiquitin carboxyl-terminal hydrolase 4/11/15
VTSCNTTTPYIKLTLPDQSVSKVKDVSRVVSTSAYLLFYRRRSNGPLGGPNLEQIIRDYDKDETSEDDEAESGEDQGLVANSSLHGSSRALTGVGAAHRQANGSNGEQMRTINPHDLDGLPVHDASPILTVDAQMNSGLPMESIEDEGIDMDSGYSNLDFSSLNKGLNQASISNWNFKGLDELNNNRGHNFLSGTGSEIDCNDNSPVFDTDASDIVQHDSSASEGSIRGRLEDFENAIPEGNGGEDFVDQSPVPDIADDNQVDTLMLHRDLMERIRPEYQVRAPKDEEIEEPATEIHVEEGEGLKIE